MTRTRFLLAIAVAAVLFEFLPAYARYIQWAVIALAGVYLAKQIFWTYPKLYRDKRNRAAQVAADERDYRSYKAELDAIRAKYDPDREPDAIAPEYQAEIGALHDRYQPMLTRKFGAR